MFHRNVSLSELECNEVIFHRYIKDRLAGNVEITHRYDLQRGTFNKAAEHKLLNPAGRTTVNRDLALIRVMFNHGVQKGLCNRSPVRKGMIDLKAESKAMRLEYLELEELRRYLNACSSQFYPVAFMAIETGLRKSEILGLKWNNVDFPNKCVYVHETKPGEPRRILVSDKLTSALCSLQCNSCGDRVFLNGRLNPYKDVRKAHEAALRDSGLSEERRKAGKPNLRFHDLRHTFATHLAVSSKDLYLVKEALGHADISTTQRYAHLTKEHYRSEIEKLSSRMNVTQRHNNVIVGSFDKDKKSDESTKKGFI